MPNPKPSELPEWADGMSAVITDPSTGYKQAGWVPGVKPPADYFNWYQNLVYQWILWLNDQTFYDLLTCLGGVVITQSTSNSDGLDVTGNGTGAGIDATGGATGVGVIANGGGNSAGVQAIGGATGPGLIASGGGSAPGATLNGGNSGGLGADIYGGGGSGGDAAHATATAGNTNGFVGSGSGTGAGLRGIGGATGSGLRATTGSGNSKGSLHLDPQATPSAAADGDVWVDSTEHVGKLKDDAGNTWKFAGHESPTAPALNANWSTLGGRTVAYYMDGTGRVQFRGALQITSGAGAATPLSAAIPSAYRPLHDFQQIVFYQSSGGTTNDFAIVEVVASTGVMTLVAHSAFSNSDTVSLDGISWMTF